MKFNVNEKDELELIVDENTRFVFNDVTSVTKVTEENLEYDIDRYLVSEINEISGFELHDSDPELTLEEKIRDAQIERSVVYPGSDMQSRLARCIKVN